MEHASLPLFVRDAHSLWLETLAELGLVGLLLLLIAFGTAFVAAHRPHRARSGQDRPLWRRWPGCWRHSWWRPASTGCGS